MPRGLALKPRPDVPAWRLRRCEGRRDLLEQRKQALHVNSGTASRRQCKECLVHFRQGSLGGGRVQLAIGPILADVRDGALERSARAFEHPAYRRIRRAGNQLLELFDDLGECLLHRQDGDLCLLGVRTSVLIGNGQGEAVSSRIAVAIRGSQPADGTTKRVAESFESRADIGRPVTPPESRRP